MKTKVLILVALFSISFAYSQEENSIPFYKNPHYFVSACGTLVFNPNWTLNSDDDEYFFNLGGILIRNGFEVAYTDDILLGVGFGIDTQINEEYYGKLITAPLYLQTRIYLPMNKESPFFVKAGIGKLLKLWKVFQKGTYYNFGIGFESFDFSDNYTYSVILEFHHKKIPTIVSGQVSSISVGIVFRVL